MTAVLSLLFAHLRRRRLQPAAIFAATLLAGLVASPGLTLYLEGRAPYDQELSRDAVADLSVEFRASVAPAAITKTPAALGASAATGPWQEAATYVFVGQNVRYTELVDRADPAGPVDRLRILKGHWITGGGQLVITRSLAVSLGVGLGGTVSLYQSPPTPLSVVGIVYDPDQLTTEETNPQLSWTSPAVVQAVATRSGSILHEVYRFGPHPSADFLTGRVAALRSSTGAGSFLSYFTSVRLRTLATSDSQSYLPLLAAFSVFGLVLCLFIIVLTVSSATLTSQTDVGTVKALGFTTGQVTATFILQAVVPAALGLGCALVITPFLSTTFTTAEAAALGIPAPPVSSPAIAATVLVVGLLLVGLTALLPARRMARRATVQALRPTDLDRTRSRPGRRLPGPVSFALGLHRIAVRPLRAGLIVLAILLGTSGLTFVGGINRALHEGQIRVAAPQASVGLSNVLPSAAGVIGALPGVTHVIGRLERSVSGPGLPIATLEISSGPAELIDGPTLVSGRWFRAPGEAVVGGNLLAGLHVRLGQTFTVFDHGHPLTFTAVGRNFTRQNSDSSIYVDASSVAASSPAVTFEYFDLTLARGVSAATIRTEVGGSVLSYLASVYAPRNATFGAPSHLFTVLSVVISLLAILGALAALLLSAKERARETAILRAVGMSGRQLTASVISGSLPLGLLGGIAGVVVGELVYRALVPRMAAALLYDLPSIFLDVWSPLTLLTLVLAGTGFAVVGSVVPARVMARASIAGSLRTE